MKMHKWSTTRPSGLVFASLLFFFVAGCRATESNSSPQWQGTLSHEPIALTVSVPESQATNALPVIFYLKNLASPRIGTESDSSILKDFRAAGYLVVTVDCAGNTNARMPFINRDLGKLRDDVRAKKLLSEFNVDMAHIFIVP